MAVDKELARRAHRNGGAAIAALPDLEEQPKATYYDAYGRSMVLPADEFSRHQYLKEGLTLSKPRRPKALPKEIDPNIAATQQDWDGRDPKLARSAPAAAPTVTYYTAAGTSFEGLSDPDSMAKYFALGMSLEPKARSRAAAKAEDKEA